MEPKMTLGEVASLLEGYGASLLPAEKNTSLYGATSDSRKVRPGDLFCAIHGAETDGNRFIDDAIARGAYAVMTDDPDAEAFVPVRESVQALVIMPFRASPRRWPVIPPGN